jgi:hypothetical protein
MALDFLRRRQWVRGADEKPLRETAIRFAEFGFRRLGS